MSNLGIQLFGSTFVVECIDQFYNAYSKLYPSITFVSVGSGCAQIEHESLSKNKEIPWLCVDPNPSSSYETKDDVFIYIRPKYKNVKELLEKEPQHKNNCLLFLNWCSPNLSTYDWEAVELLSPIAILTLGEFDFGLPGAAGSALFYKKMIEKENDSYNTVHRISLLPPTPKKKCSLNGTIIWFQNKSLDTIPKVTLPYTKNATKEWVNECVTF